MICRRCFGCKNIDQVVLSNLRLYNLYNPYNSEYINTTHTTSTNAHNQSRAEQI